VDVKDKGGLKLLAEINTGLSPAPPPQMVLMSATAEGDLTRAFDLKPVDLSAFGYFFARAFQEDWACVDTTPDGIITVTELEGYLQKRLDRAHKLNLIEGNMRPLARDEQRFSFLAYDDKRYSLDGVRDRIVELYVQVPYGQVATLAFSDGTRQSCPPNCLVFTSASFQGTLEVRSRMKIHLGGGAKAAIFTHDAVEATSSEPKTIEFARVLRQKQGMTLDNGVILKVR
jgi:hypothetical protein